MLLGVIGGLGPMATALFMRYVTELTDAKTDQEHIEMLIHSAPSIPDRTAFILKKSTLDPRPGMIEVGKGLRAQGADIIAIPCMTAHHFHAELEREIGLPIINGIEATAEYLASRGAKKVGIAATEGSVKTGLFQNALIKAGVEPLTLSKEGQSIVTDTIYKEIKAGMAPDMERFSLVTKEYKQMGADAMILGCTELSLLPEDGLEEGFHADAMKILARRAVLAAGKELAK